MKITKVHVRRECRDHDGNSLKPCSGCGCYTYPASVVEEVTLRELAEALEGYIYTP